MATRTIRFNGFTTASAVTIAAALSGGQSDSASTGAGGWNVPPSTASAEIQIVTRNPGRFAPDGIGFEVTNLQGFDTPATHAPTADAYKPQRHAIEVFWTFGDAGSVYSAPVNTLAEHKNRNVAKGHRAYHVYRTPGSYTVTAWLVEMSSGKTATATLMLSGDKGATTDAVKDQDAVFPGACTAWIGPVETWSRAPAGAITATSYASIQGKSVSQGGLPNASSGNRVDLAGNPVPTAESANYDPSLNAAYARGRVIFASGHVETPAYGLSIDRWPELCRLFVAEPGAAVKPKIMLPAGVHPTYSFDDEPRFFQVFSETNRPGQYLILQGLETESYYDPTTEEGMPYIGVSIVGDRTGAYILVDDMTMPGHNTAVSSGGERSSYLSSNAIIVHDCRITNWQNFGVFMAAAHHAAVLGCYMKQDAAALTGGPKFTNPPFNNHGPCRFAFTERLVIDGCDMRSHNAWDSDMDGLTVVQPCIRLNTNADPDGQSDVTRCTLEGGWTVINNINATSVAWDAARGQRTANTVIDACVIVGHHMTAAALTEGYGGLTFRNNLVILPNTPKAAPAAVCQGAIKLYPIPMADGSDSDVMLGAPIQVYGNTFLNHLNAANDSFAGTGQMAIWYQDDRNLDPGNTRFPDPTEENNILHQPNATGAVNLDGPLDQTALWVSAEGGPRERWRLIRYPLPSDWAPGATVSLPYPSGVTKDNVVGREHRVVASAIPAMTMTVTLNSSTIDVRNDAAEAIPQGREVFVAIDMFGSAGNTRTQHATPADTIWRAAPLETSSALGAALTGLTSYSDIRMEQRPVYPSRGAWEL